MSIIEFSSIPGRYAKALFEIGVKHKCLDTFEKNFDILFNCLPSLPLQNNYEEICKILKFNKYFSNFIKVIVGYKRIKLLKSISRIFHKAVLKSKNIREVTIYSVIPVEIDDYVNKFFPNEKLILKYEIDKSLLSGLKIKADGILIDASGRNFLNKF